MTSGYFVYFQSIFKFGIILYVFYGKLAESPSFALKIKLEYFQLKFIKYCCDSVNMYVIVERIKVSKYFQL